MLAYTFCQANTAIHSYLLVVLPSWFIYVMNPDFFHTNITMAKLLDKIFSFAYPQTLVFWVSY